MTDVWNKSEIVAIVEDYLDMLECELQGKNFNKTQNQRTIIIIERKFPWSFSWN